MNIIHPSLLVNLDVVKELRGQTAPANNATAADISTNDALWKRSIKQASAWFENETKRAFVPFRQTRVFDALGEHISARCLDVDADLLDIIMLTNGDGTTIANSAYVLRPSSGTPKYRIELKSSSGLVWTYSDGYEEAISVDGWWGYHENYAQAWQTVDALASALDASGTLAVISDPDGLDEFGFGPRVGTLDYIRIDSEMLLVTAITGSTLTVRRGVNGSTAGTHAQSSDVDAYRQAGDIQRAVGFLAGYYYDVKDTSGNGIQILDFAMKVERTIAEEVFATKERYRVKDGKPL